MMCKAQFVVECKGKVSQSKAKKVRQDVAKFECVFVFNSFFILCKFRIYNVKQQHL